MRYFFLGISFERFLNFSLRRPRWFGAPAEPRNAFETRFNCQGCLADIAARRAGAVLRRCDYII